MNKKIIILYFLTICFSSMKTTFNNIEYIKREIQAIDLGSVGEDMVFFPFYINNNEKAIDLKPILAIRNSQVGFELDSINAINLITWISPGMSIELYQLYKLIVFQNYFRSRDVIIFRARVISFFCFKICSFLNQTKL